MHEKVAKTWKYNLKNLKIPRNALNNITQALPEEKALSHKLPLTLNECNAFIFHILVSSFGSFHKLCHMTKPIFSGLNTSYFVIIGPNSS